MEIRPQAVAIPKSTDHLEKGKYGPIFHKTPACYGFTIIANVKPGRADAMRAYGQRLAKALEGRPVRARAAQAPLPALGALRRRHPVHVPGHLRHRLRQVHRGRGRPLPQDGHRHAFENLEGFPTDWKTNTAAFVKFVREHQCQSFLEYGEYPYVSSDEIKKALQDQGRPHRDARADAVGAAMGEAKPARTYNQNHHPRSTRRAAGASASTSPGRYPGEANRDADGARQPLLDDDRGAARALARLRGRRSGRTRRGSSRGSRGRSSCSSGRG